MNKVELVDKFIVSRYKIQNLISFSTLTLMFAVHLNMASPYRKKEF
jgi:hypothetical protein